MAFFSEFGASDKFPFPGFEVFCFQMCESPAVKMLHAVACGGDHTFDLVVFSLGNGQEQCGRAFQYGIGGVNRFVFVVEQDTVFQGFAKRFAGRVLECNFVQFGDFMVGGSQLVVQVSVVGNQQYAGRIRIQPADRLHIDVPHIVGEQAEYAAVVLRFV